MVQVKGVAQYNPLWEERYTMAQQDELSFVLGAHGLEAPDL